MSDHESPPPPTNGIRDGLPEDTIRIMLATDNHIGYMERDPVRGRDSINTFKEILQLAVKHDVDFILLGGDLFHENKPSRECLYQVTALLREYTLGDKPVQIELLSDPLEGNAAGFSFPAVNYNDPNLNVAIPVFSIHGNHDDPQGAGEDGALCALDILSVTGLVNYMGKFDLPLSMSDSTQPDALPSGINIRPVLLRKGKTRLGLYGVGNVKDQRMHFELRSNRVNMYVPKDKESWFNLMVVHQNRVKHGPQEYVPEGMFDDCVDLVVWGHEHDCRIIPEPVAGKNYYISQPGSSVATSLADGEAIEKHVALLEIQHKEFKLTPIPLRSVRPFVIEQVVLSDVAEETGLDLNDQMKISKYLRERANALIQQAGRLWDERNARAIAEGQPELPKILPLIRLKVDTTGVTQTFNPIRFGQEFTGLIANPRDALAFHRAKKAPKAAGTTRVNADEPELSIDDPNLSISEKLHKVRVGTLVKEYLAAQELQVIGETGMSDAIRVFVEKDDVHAIQTHVGKALQELIKNVQRNEDGDVPEDELEDMLVKAKEKQDKEYIETAKTKPKSKGKGKSKASRAADNENDEESADSMAMDLDVGRGDLSDDFNMDMDEEEEAVVPKKKGRKTTTTQKKAAAPKATATKKTAAKGRGKKKVADLSDEEEDEIIELDELDEDQDDDDSTPVVKKTNRAAVLSQPTTTKKATTKKTAAPKTRAKATAQSQLIFAPSGRSSRAAASQARRKMVVEDEDDDDDD